MEQPESNSESGPFDVAEFRGHVRKAASLLRVVREEFAAQGLTDEDAYKFFLESIFQARKQQQQGSTK